MLGAGAAALAWAAGCSKPPASQPSAVSSEEVRYGDHPKQAGTLRVPLEPTARPVVVLVHGGYWSPGFTRESMAPISDDLTRLGYATWNIDYRTVGEDGGGWPVTAEDVGAGIDKLTALTANHRLDLEKVVFLGHSAGAQLMVWAAARTGRDGREGAAVHPKAAVSLSGVLDLSRAAAGGNGDLQTLADSTLAFMGGSPDDRPARYRQADPIELLPLGIPMLVMHGAQDKKVPPEHSRAFTDRALRAGDTVSLVELPKADHFDVIRPTKAWWDEVLRWLPTIVGDPLG